MPLYPTRIRLPSGNYLGRQTYFVTICCADRRPVFANPVAGRWALAELFASASKHFFSLHCFCLMPDHLHFLAKGTADDCDLTKFVHVFKQRTSYEYRKRHQRQLWQTRFYDHILRRNDAIEDVACYICANPVRKGLCADPMLYPLSGSQTIDWIQRGPSNTKWLPPWKMKTPG
jgi:putative transposase